eukprot:6985832-Alexandrium_andersonii.AAC.2
MSVMNDVANATLLDIMATTIAEAHDLGATRNNNMAKELNAVIMGTVTTIALMSNTELVECIWHRHGRHLSTSGHDAVNMTGGKISTTSEMSTSAMNCMHKANKMQLANEFRELWAATTSTHEGVRGRCIMRAAINSRTPVGLTRTATLASQLKSMHSKASSTQ